MEYASPILHVAGTAQALVLGSPSLGNDSPCGSTGFSTACLEVIGLDD